MKTFSSQESVRRCKRLQGGAERGAAMNCIGFQGRLPWRAGMEGKGLHTASYEAGLLSAIYLSFPEMNPTQVFIARQIHFIAPYLAVREEPRMHV